jgi:hypothetical protein
MPEYMVVSRIDGNPSAFFTSSILEADKIGTAALSCGGSMQVYVLNEYKEYEFFYSTEG